MFWSQLCSKLNLQRNWVFTTNSNFLIPISFQPDVITLWYFKLRLFDRSNRIHSLKYIRSTTFGCTDIRTIKLEFVAKTQFLFYANRMHVIGGYKITWLFTFWLKYFLLRPFWVCIRLQVLPSPIQTVSEFNEFEPRLKSAKTGFNWVPAIF